MQGEYRAKLVLKQFVFYSVDLVRPKMKKIAHFVMPKIKKMRIICFAENDENHASFVEGFMPEFYAYEVFHVWWQVSFKKI